MFYTIHRSIKLMLFCCVGLVLWKIYEQRGIFEPAWIWAEVWDNGGFRVPEAENFGGRVLQVMNSQTFIISPKLGTRYNVRLMGLREPSKDVSPELFEHELKRKQALEDLIKGKWVTLEKLYSSANNLGGVIWVQGTNVNADLVMHGWQYADRETVKGMPKEDQYALLYAASHRKKATWK